MEQNIYILLAGDIMKFLVGVSFISLYWAWLYREKEEKKEHYQEKISDNYTIRE